MRAVAPNKKIQGQNKGGAAGQLFRALTHKGHQDVNAKIRNCDASKLRFVHAKDFSEKYPLFGRAPSKTFASPVPGRKSLTLRLLMSYIYGAPILDVSRSHTTTQHSR